MKRKNFALISLIVVTIFFASCGDTQFDNTQSAAVESNSDAGSHEEGSSKDERKIVKTASISLNVDHLEKSIIQLKSFLKPINGYVYNYEISNQSNNSDSYQKNMDSTVLVEKVSPEGNLSVRVPIAYADSFINYVLNSDAQIASLKISDDDITENLWEKKQIAEVYVGSGKAQKNKASSKNISYDNNTSIDAIKAKALAAKMDYKTKHLWFDINMTAKPFYKTTTIITAKNYRTPIHVSMANALSHGWHIFADILLALISIWPIMILLGVLLFFVRKYRLRQV